MKQMEERYKKYLEKAKSVIRTLDPKQNQGAAPEIQALKNQLQEQDRLFHSLEVISMLFSRYFVFPWCFLGIDCASLILTMLCFKCMLFGAFFRKNMKKQRVKEKWRRSLSLVPGTIWE
uniref:Hook C-terminal domain-containing protein n=1 Tax=Dromaius novaehollandiae TaxID=8790 RepID=A0A8C4IYM7_DRONO